MSFANNTIARIITMGVDYVRYARTGLNVTTYSQEYVIDNATLIVNISPILLGNDATFLTLGGQWRKK